MANVKRGRKVNGERSRSFTALREEHEWGTLREKENTSYCNWRIWGIVNLHKHSNWNSGDWMWVHMPIHLCPLQRHEDPHFWSQCFLWAKGIQVSQKFIHYCVLPWFVVYLHLCALDLGMYLLIRSGWSGLDSKYLFLLNRSLPSPASSWQYPRMMTGDRW